MDDDEHDVLYRDDEGNEQYETWSRYEFLTRDADGAWCWDDDYLFACDSSLSLMSDRRNCGSRCLPTTSPAHTAIRATLPR